MQVLLSFTGGVLLGVGLLHLLPHAILEFRGDVPATMVWVVAGFFLMFLLERVFHGHAHHTADGGPTHHPHTHGESCGHAHRHGHQAGRWSWCGAFAGLALHSLADGAALAASVGSDAAHGGGLLAGLATFLAILLHKPFDSGIIATLMIEAGVSVRVRRLAIAAYALIVPIGALAFLASLHLVGPQQSAVVGPAMAMAAGAFICIAAADLLGDHSPGADLPRAPRACPRRRGARSLAGREKGCRDVAQQIGCTRRSRRLPGARCS
jgi:zinc and cadmium transporter